MGALITSVACNPAAAGLHAVHRRDSVSSVVGGCGIASVARPAADAAVERRVVECVVMRCPPRTRRRGGWAAHADGAWIVDGGRDAAPSRDRAVKKGSGEPS